MQPHSVLVTVLVLVQCSWAHCDVLKGDNTTSFRDEVRLCDALETVRPGDRIPITVSGMYTSGFEIAMLHDPEKPQCNLDVQPSTSIRFGPAVGTASPENYQKLVRLLDAERMKTKRLYVTFQGELLGPKPTGVDNPEAPVMIAFANRAAGRRYGHLGSFRTELVVRAVLSVEPVPVSVPSNWLRHRVDDSSERPLPISSAVPIYPYKAWYTGIGGQVVVNVRVEAGKVIEAAVSTGERMLRAATLENIQSWSFQEDVTAAFKTTFVYELELRPTGSSPHPRVIMELPGRVTIIGAENGW